MLGDGRVHSSSKMKMSLRDESSRPMVRSWSHGGGVRWALIAMAGCSYQGGSYRDMRGAWPGTRVELGCVDLAVSRAEGSVIRYSFGNRCDERVLLDLASVRVMSAGVAQQPYDPRGEIHAATLPALLYGTERIEYQPGGGPLCVDVGGVNGSIARTERWVCL